MPVLFEISIFKIPNFSTLNVQKHYFLVFIKPALILLSKILTIKAFVFHFLPSYHWSREEWRGLGQNQDWRHCGLCAPEGTLHPLPIAPSDLTVRTGEVPGIPGGSFEELWWCMLPAFSRSKDWGRADLFFLVCLSIQYLWHFAYCQKNLYQIQAQGS